jgi:2-methylisocitrate lyase-like PEP mutase family enzyme
MPSTEEKRKAFRALHERGCFVIPNPFDMGSARWLQGLGFKALATTSSGAAWSYGYPDGGLARDVMLEQFYDISAVSDVPVNADFLNGFADEPEDLIPNVVLCVGTGVAGISIEDMNADRELYDTGLAVERIRAARRALDDDGTGVLLVARCEAFVIAHPDALRIALDRVERFVEAGADVIYVPHLARLEDIAAVVKAAGPKPVNVLARNFKGLTVADLAPLGVRRISVGGTLARTAWAAVIRTGKDLAEGRFDALEDAAPGSVLDAFFAEDAARRA